MRYSDLQLGDGSRESWGSAANEFVDSVGDSDVFGVDWARQQQAHLLALDHQEIELAESLVLLTATASTTYPSSSTSIPPVVHFEEGILSSMQACQKALSRALSGVDWRAVRVYGVDDRGYLHRHTGVYVADDSVDVSTFDRWISAHTNNSSLAEPEAHGDGAVRVDHEVEVDDGRSWVAGYLMANTPGCDTRSGRDHGLQSAQNNVQRGAVVLDRVDEPAISYGKPI